METPTINKKQAKKALSTKKKPEVIKNILIKPYKNYWPVLSAEDNIHLLNILRESLPRLCLTKINVPYKDIKSVAKEERKEFRKSLCKDPAVESADNLVFGVNSVSKLLETQEACCVLVASNVQPRLFVQHILDLAVLYSIPILVVKDLRNVFKEKCGISGAVIGFKKVVTPGKLDVIVQAIVTMHENYPAPKKHINYNRKLNVSTITIPDSDDGSFCEILEENQNDFLLKRVDNKKRVFVPPKSIPKQTSFIGFSEPPPPVKQLNVKRKMNYNNLVVKRVKGDKNRNKKKINKFKKNK